jgi:hypothetical protein
VVGKINKTDQAESLVDVPSSGFKSGRSFVEVLRSTSGGEEKASVLKVVSSSPLDLFPVHSGFELGSIGEMRSAVDCYELESLSWSPAAAAVSLSPKKTKGNVSISGLLRNLGQMYAKLDWGARSL